MRTYFTNSNCAKTQFVLKQSLSIMRKGHLIRQSEWSLKLYPVRQNLGYDGSPLAINGPLKNAPLGSAYPAYPGYPWE